MPLSLNARQVSLDFAERLLLRRDLFLLFQVGLVRRHQILELRDAPLVPAQQCTGDRARSSPGVMFRQGLLEFRQGQIILRVLDRLLKGAQIRRLKIDQILFGLLQAVLRLGDRLIGRGDSRALSPAS